MRNNIAEGDFNLVIDTRKFNGSTQLEVKNGIATILKQTGTLLAAKTDISEFATPIPLTYDGVEVGQVLLESQREPVEASHR